MSNLNEAVMGACAEILIEEAKKRTQEIARLKAEVDDGINDIKELAAEIRDARSALDAAEAEVERLKELLQIATTDRDKGGKTILDFMNVWLEQERDKVSSLRASLAAAEAREKELREKVEMMAKKWTNRPLEYEAAIMFDELKKILKG
jgi:chromosome segregation ATPase